MPDRPVTLEGIAPIESRKRQPAPEPETMTENHNDTVRGIVERVRYIAQGLRDDGHPIAAEQIDEAATLLSQQAARIEELAEELRPFAAHAAYYAFVDEAASDRVVDIPATVRALRRARAALEGTKP